ncbi:MAG: CPBP family intramembrane metalloprotease [Bryobacteraceae bacterium]|nr:CPBP family intramembrane metalloprotease [Bryobacteraceae bacterium]
MSLAANPWEEVGWRGFALTRLQRTYTPLTAALIVGILWGLWHIPLFLWAKSPMSAFPFIDWFVGILGMSCILAWLYNSANQSLAVAMVFHISTNVFGALTGIHSHFALAMVTTTAAIGLVCRYGRTLGFDGSPSRGVALHVTL